MRSASARSAGTYTSPARMASAGWRNETGDAVDEELAAARAGWRRTGCRTARPGPGPRGRRRRGPRRGRARTRRRSACVPARRSRAAMRGASALGGRGRRRCGGRAAAAHRLAAAISPSISATIRSSEPSVTSTTPTVSPSRRTVARSQTAAISISRWEMKMMERSVPRWPPTTSRTRSVRSAGRAAVISSSSSTSGSMARARARSMTRSVARGRSRARSRAGRGRRCPAGPSQCRNGLDGACRSGAGWTAMSRSGMRAGSW